MADKTRSDAPLKRPFWLHQAAEYLLGLALVAAGVQSPDPAFPVLAGGLIVLNAAMVVGPLGAWRAVARPLHRNLDLVVIGIVGVTALLPFLAIDNTSRFMMIGVAVIMAVVWTQSDFAPARQRRPGDPVQRSEAIGRTAGRLYAHGRAYARKRSADPGTTVDSNEPISRTAGRLYARRKADARKRLR